MSSNLIVSPSFLFFFFSSLPPLNLSLRLCLCQMIRREVKARGGLRQILIQPLQQRFTPIDLLSLSCLICWITCLTSKKKKETAALATEDN